MNTGTIEELNVFEMDQVDGAFPPLVALVLTLYGTEIAYAAAGVVGFGLVWYAAHN